MKKAAAVLILLLAAPAAACPACKESVATPVAAGQGDSGVGFNAAIALLLGAAGVGAAGVGGLMFVGRAASQPRANGP